MPAHAAPSLIDANSPHGAWPKEADDRLIPVIPSLPNSANPDCSAKLRLLLLDLPIEAVLNERGFNKTLDDVPSGPFERRVLASSLRYVTSIAYAARMFDAQAPASHAPPFRAAFVVEESIEERMVLTARHCGGIDRPVAPVKPFLPNGVPPREPLAPGVAEWVVVQAPCDSGKSDYALEQALAAVQAERGDRVLHLSPSHLLTERHTADIEHKARAMHREGRLPLATLQHVVGRLHCYKEHEGGGEDEEAAAAGERGGADEIVGRATWLTCCVDSVPTCAFGAGGQYEFGARIVILEDVRQIVDSIFCAEAAAGKRRKLWLALRTVLAHAELVLVLDRDIDVFVRLALGSALLYAYRTVSHDVEGARRAICIRHIKLAQFHRNIVTVRFDHDDCFDAIVRDLRAGLKVVVFDASATQAAALAEFAKGEMGLGVCLVEAKTPDADKRRLAADHRRVLRNVQLFVYTSALDVGFSIEVPFDAFYVFGGNWLPWRTMQQALMRIRELRGQSPFERRFTLCTVGMSKLRDANSTAQRSMPTIGTALHRFVYDLERTDALAKSLAADIPAGGGAARPAPTLDDTDVLVLTAHEVKQLSRRLQAVEWHHVNVLPLAPPPPPPPPSDQASDAHKKRRQSAARTDTKRQRRAAATPQDAADDSETRTPLGCETLVGHAVLASPGRCSTANLLPPRRLIADE